MVIVSHGSVSLGQWGCKDVCGCVLWVCKCHHNFTGRAERGGAGASYVTQVSNLMRLMFPPSCSCSFAAMRSSAEEIGRAHV